MRTLSFWLVELVLSHRSVYNLTRLALTILDRYIHSGQCNETRNNFYYPYPHDSGPLYTLLRTLHNKTQKHFFITRYIHFGQCNET